jgi:hypothetical protein
MNEHTLRKVKFDGIENKSAVMVEQKYLEQVNPNIMLSPPVASVTTSTGLKSQVDETVADKGEFEWKPQPPLKR